MPTDVVMPQMGESIAEGTIVRWIKNVGDRVERDEPLFEISTDKVDAEIPSPAAGVITEIMAEAGATVPVNSVVAVIGEGDARPAAAPPAARQESAGARDAPAPAQDQADGTAATSPHAEPPSPKRQDATPPKPAASSPEPAPPTPPAPTAAGAAPPPSKDEQRRQKSSPLVRRIAKEHDIDISQLSGSGIDGRVTKADILSHLGREGTQGDTRVPGATPPPAQAPAFREGERVEIVPMPVMRRKIAEHMVMSKRTSAHVHSVFEVGFAKIHQLRESMKADFEKAGTKLTYLTFIIRAVTEALRAVPVINASIDGDKIVYKKDINIGVAVALDWGLIVPVIRDADEKNLLGLSRALADLAARARAKQLKPEEVQGGTFTITNPGTFGALFGMPIINQPQVAILGVGAIEKRAVVIDDAIAIRPMAYLTLGYDHRLIDGAVADEFMSELKKRLETFDAVGS
jgi:2-oxoglutarate dehydrogenase E2 component (dihydrolipoamide succinyltransferase)